MIFIHSRHLFHSISSKYFILFHLFRQVFHSISFILASISFMLASISFYFIHSGKSFILFLFHSDVATVSFQCGNCFIPMWQLFHSLLHSCHRINVSFRCGICFIPMWQLFHSLLHSCHRIIVSFQCGNCFILCFILAIELLFHSFLALVSAYLNQEIIYY